MVQKVSKKKAAGAICASTRILALGGPEEVLRREAVAQLQAAMEVEHGEVELLTFNGETAELADVMDELRSFGLMQQYKIVLVQNADDFVSNHRKVLERYAENPVDHGTLVLACATWRPGNIDKLIAKVGAIIDCKQLSATDVKARLIETAKTEHHRRLSPQAAQLLIERVGPHLLRLEQEVAKLALLVEEGQGIETELIDQVVGRSSDEQAWAAQEAVLTTLNDPRAGIATTIAKLRELIDLSRQADTLVAYFVADLVRKLYLGLILQKQGVSAFQITQQMKMWGPRQTMFQNALRRLSEPAAARLFDRIVRLDVRAKSGLGDPTRNLECFCAELVDQIK